MMATARIVSPDDRNSIREAAEMWRSMYIELHGDRARTALSPYMVAAGTAARLHKLYLLPGQAFAVVTLQQDRLLTDAPPQSVISQLYVTPESRHTLDPVGFFAFVLFDAPGEVVGNCLSRAESYRIAAKRFEMVSAKFRFKGA